MEQLQIQIPFQYNRSVKHNRIVSNNTKIVIFWCSTPHKFIGETLSRRSQQYELGKREKEKRENGVSFMAAFGSVVLLSVLCFTFFSINFISVF